MEHELLVVLYEDLVGLLHVHFGSERHGREALGLAAGEDSRTVGAGQVVDLAPDRTDFVADAAVETDSLVEDHVAHRLLLLGMVVSLYERGLLLELLLGYGGEELLLYGLEAGLPLLLGLRRLGEGIALVVAEVVHGLPELLVLHVVGIVTLVDVGAELVHELLLHAAVPLDLLVGELDCLEHGVLADLVHLALYHHDVLLGGRDHEVEVGVLHLREVRVDHELAVYPAHAYLGDRASERKVGCREGAGGSKACERIGLDVVLGRDEGYVHEHLEVEVIRPEGTDRPVYEA